MKFPALRLSQVLAGGFALVMPTPAPAGHPIGHAPYLVFKSLDADNDGRLTRTEYSTGTRQLFSDMDTNHDGRVTADEMAAIYTASGEIPTEMKATITTRMAAETIRLSDIDNDGELTAAEHAAGDEAMFNRLDQNHDGWLSQSECEAGKAMMKKGQAGLAQ